MAAKPQNPTIIKFGDEKVQFKSMSMEMERPLIKKPRSLFNPPAPNEMLVDTYYPGEVESTIRIVVDKLAENVKSGVGNIIELNIQGPEQKVWGAYPDWVWWTPKPENEKHYRFLGIGKEIVIRHDYYLPQVLVKELRQTGPFEAEVSLMPLSPVQTATVNVTQ